VLLGNDGNLYRPTAGPSRFDDVFPDGERFVVVRAIAEDQSAAMADSFNFVLNWTQELLERVPTGR
jgi:hypothetical protein